MKRSHVRGLVYLCHAVAVAGLLGALANCSGGERPPAGSDTPIDAGPKPDVAAGSITITPLEDDGSLVFGTKGLVPCGTQAQDKTLTLTNTTPNIINYKADLTQGADLFKVAPETGGIPVGGKVSIQVTPNAIPQTSEITTDLYAGTLSITTSPTDPPTVIRLHQTAEGAIITTVAGATGLDFGSVKVGTPATQPFNLTNGGNVDTAANLILGTTAYKIDGQTTAQLPLAAGATGSKTITLTPTAATGYADTVAISFAPNTVHCKPPPTSVNLTGTGVTSVGVTPGTVNFGNVNCGTTAPAGPTAITITSATDMSFTPTLSKSFYSLTDNAGVPLVLGAAIAYTAPAPYVIKVVPLPIPSSTLTTANLFGDTLTILTNVASDLPHTVIIQQSAQGAIFGWTPQAGFAHSSATINQTFSDLFNVVNSGNAAAAFTITSTKPGTFVTTLGGGSGAIGNTTGTINTTAPATFSTPVVGALHMTSSGVLCADIPADLSLSVATGVGTSISIDKGNLNFGQVDCGTTASPAFQTLTITSLVPANITPNLGQAGASPYTLADNAGTPLVLGASIPLAANVPYMMRVNVKQVPTRPTQGIAVLTDNLTINSDIGGEPTKTIPLNETPRGVIFSFNPTSLLSTMVTAPATKSPLSFTLKNAGNVAGNYTLTAGAGFFTSNLTTGTAQVGDTPGTVNFSGTGVAQLNIASTSVLCADLPNLPITSQ